MWASCDGSDDCSENGPPRFEHTEASVTRTLPGRFALTNMFNCEWRGDHKRTFYIEHPPRATFHRPRAKLNLLDKGLTILA